MPEQAALTYADLAAFPDDMVKRELIDGELIVSPSARPRHQEVGLRLCLAFGNHLAQYGGGKVFYELDTVFTDRDVVRPDVLFIADEQVDIITDVNVQGAPALVIEVLSDARHDCVRKRAVYARYGGAEYWIVDPESDRVEVYRPAGSGYGKPEILELGETLTYARLPGLQIDLEKLFAR